MFHFIHGAIRFVIHAASQTLDDVRAVAGPRGGFLPHRLPPSIPSCSQRGGVTGKRAGAGAQSSIHRPETHSVPPSCDHRGVDTSRFSPWPAPVP